MGHESKSSQKKGAQGGTTGALQGAQGVGQESKSLQKNGAQGAGQDPGRGCAWEFKAFQKQCAHRQEPCRVHRVWAMNPGCQESKSWQKKGAQDGTPGALQGAQDTVWRIIRPDQFPSIESLQLCVIRKLQLL